MNHELGAATLRALASGLEWQIERGGASDAGEVSATLSIAVLERLCAGHFPGAAVVPGAHLLGCLFDLARYVDASPLVVERCVFRSQVTPVVGVRISVRPGGEGRVIGEVHVPGMQRPAAVATFSRA